jgi:NADPH:quinone reductase-like Zn-dependent oxidoreductase
MLAIAVPEFGGPEVLELRDVPIPTPGPGQARVRVRSSTVAKIDISTRNGAIGQAGLLGRHLRRARCPIRAPADPRNQRHRARGIRRRRSTG